MLTNNLCNKAISYYLMVNILLHIVTHAKGGNSITPYNRMFQWNRQIYRKKCLPVPAVTHHSDAWVIKMYRAMLVFVHTI